MSYYNASRDQIKNMFLSLLYGGRPDQWLARHFIAMPTPGYHSYVLKFSMEIQQCVLAVIQDHVDVCRVANPKLCTPLSLMHLPQELPTILFHILSRYESRSLELVVENLENEGRSPVCLLFDGLFAPIHGGDTNATTDELVAHANDVMACARLPLQYQLKTTPPVIYTAEQTLQGSTAPRQEPESSDSPSGAITPD